MKTTKWITVRHDGAAKMTVSKPVTGPQEVAVLIEINIPDAVFHKPTFKAVLQFTEGEQPDLSQVDTNVIADAIKGVTGFDVHVVLPEIVAKDN